MSLVRVKDFWVNPDAVVAIWYNRVAYRGEEPYWVAKIRCDEGQSWEWKHETEESAQRDCDELAAQVNGSDGRDEYGVWREVPDYTPTPEQLARWAANRAEAERHYAERKDLR